MIHTSAVTTKRNWALASILPDHLLRQSYDGWQLGLLDGHAIRVAAYSYLIAKQLGLREEEADKIRVAAALHDIGKLMLPEEILSKPGLLNPEERTRVEAHTLYGYEMLKSAEKEGMDVAAEIALYHHEKVDGSGYPYGLQGDKIPLSARIVSVADVFDALTTNRAYRNARAEKETLELLLQGKDSHFDGSVLSAFETVLLDYIQLGTVLRDFTRAYTLAD